MPKIRLIATRSEESNGGRVEDLEEEGMDVTLVCGERRVIEAPVSEIISGGVAVPVFDREIERDLHPMPLRLVVAEPRRSAGAGVRVERHRHPHQNRE